MGLVCYEKQLKIKTFYSYASETTAEKIKSKKAFSTFTVISKKNNNNNINTALYVTSLVFFRKFFLIVSHRVNLLHQCLCCLGGDMRCASRFLEYLLGQVTIKSFLSLRFIVCLFIFLFFFFIFILPLFNSYSTPSLFACLLPPLRCVSLWSRFLVLPAPSEDFDVAELETSVRRPLLHRDEPRLHWPERLDVDLLTEGHGDAPELPEEPVGAEVPRRDHGLRPCPDLDLVRQGDHAFASRGLDDEPDDAEGPECAEVYQEPGIVHPAHK